MAGLSQMEVPAVSFGGLLRQLRAEARMTQEELAEKAGLSPRSISDLERGISRTARKDTADLLAGALSIGGSVRTAFVAAARGRAPVSDVLREREFTAAGAPVALMHWDPGYAASSSPPETEVFERLIDALTALLRVLAALSRGPGRSG
jgi:transcriptional regulator with XRE-family HTH domain